MARADGGGVRLWWARLCALFLACALSAPGAEAGGGVSIFLFGKEIDHAPWPVFAMYVMVIIVSVFYELLTHHIDHVIHSASGKAIVSHIYKEVMILGGISLLLTVLENTAGELVFPPAFYHYVHFVIFFMALNLIGCVSLLFLFIGRWWTHWEFFERWTGDIENDPRWTLEERHALVNSFVSRYTYGTQMLSCILFYRSNLPVSLRAVEFTRYMRKQQRKALLTILDLHASAWTALAFLVLLVALQNHITGLVISDEEDHSYVAEATPAPPTLSDQCLATIESVAQCGMSVVPMVAGTGSSSGSGSASGSTSDSGSGSGEGSSEITEYELVVMLLFVGIEGYGMLVVFTIFYFAYVRKSYHAFTENIEALRLAQRLTPMVSQRTYFWKENPPLTLSIMQAMLLCQVFYLATVTCNYAPRWLADEIALTWGWVIFVVSLIPPIVTTTFLLPRMMPVYTILTSVGDLLDVLTIQTIKKKDDSSGIYRRLALRKRATTAPPPYFDEAKSPLDAYVQALMLREEELNFQSAPGSPGTGSPNARMDREIKRVKEYYASKERVAKASGAVRHELDRLICDECKDQYAHSHCGVCGLLCRHCDLDYHKLKRHRGHLVIPLQRGGHHEHVHPVLLTMGLLTCDSPLISDPPAKSADTETHVNRVLSNGAALATPPIVMKAPDMPSFGDGQVVQNGVEGYGYDQGNGIEQPTPLHVNGAQQVPWRSPSFDAGGGGGRGYLQPPTADDAMVVAAQNSQPASNRGLLSPQGGQHLSPMAAHGGSFVSKGSLPHGGGGGSFRTPTSVGGGPHGSFQGGTPTGHLRPPGQPPQQHTLSMRNPNSSPHADALQGHGLLPHTSGGGGGGFLTSNALQPRNSGLGAGGVPHPLLSPGAQPRSQRPQAPVPATQQLSGSSPTGSPVQETTLMWPQ